jgi:hypothetical protein
MNEIKIKKTFNADKSWLRKPVQKNDYDSVISEDDFKVIDGITGEPIAFVVKFDNPISEKVDSFLDKIKITNQPRSSGINKKDRIRTASTNISFGYRPFRPLNRLPAGPMAFNSQYPNWYRCLTEHCKEATKIYENVLPGVYSEHLSWTKENLSLGFLMNEGPFNQGVVNRNNLLPYHYDLNNYKKGWSLMYVSRHNVFGGYLVLPEYRVALETKHRQLLIFQGSNILHGVSEIKRINGGNRHTIVYYTNETIKNTKDLAQSISKARIAQQRKRQAIINGTN